MLLIFQIKLGSVVGGDYYKMDALASIIMRGNIRINKIISDEAGGKLEIIGINEKYREVLISYADVFYSQLDESFIGQNITQIYEITLKGFCTSQHFSTVQNFLADCGADIGFLKEMTKRGSHLYLQNLNLRGVSAEYLVIAKTLIIS